MAEHFVPSGRHVKHAREKICSFQRIMPKVPYYLSGMSERRLLFFLENSSGQRSDMNDKKGLYLVLCGTNLKKGQFKAMVLWTWGQLVRSLCVCEVSLRKMQNWCLFTQDCQVNGSIQMNDANSGTLLDLSTFIAARKKVCDLKTEVGDAERQKRPHVGKKNN